MTHNTITILQIMVAQYLTTFRIPRRFRGPKSCPFVSGQTVDIDEEDYQEEEKEEDYQDYQEDQKEEEKEESPRPDTAKVKRLQNYISRMSVRHDIALKKASDEISLQGARLEAQAAEFGKEFQRRIKETRKVEALTKKLRYEQNVAFYDKKKLTERIAELERMLTCYQTQPNINS